LLPGVFLTIETHEQRERTGRREGGRGGHARILYPLHLLFACSKRRHEICWPCRLVPPSLSPSLSLLPPSLHFSKRKRKGGEAEGREGHTHTQEKGEERGRVGKTAWVCFAPLLPSLPPLPLNPLNYTFGAKVRDRVDRTGIHEEWKGGKEGGRDLPTAQQARRRQRIGEEGVGRD